MISIDISQPILEKTFQLAPFLPTFNVGIHHAFKEKLQDAPVTHETALRIFREIKLKSDILSVITNPITIIAAGSILVVGSCLLHLAGLVALTVAAIFLGTIGGVITGYGIQNGINGFLGELSEAYEHQSKKAQKYINLLEQYPTASVQVVNFN